ncbi:hypothetical protein [Flavobacterium sp.]|uniref:hypothetical protein n=1 Tax=Flavobacterium sp. TaxID=239 RepID=UPI00261F8687|nr:hypothetical protein [Flavobacterium sp.]
MIWENKIKGNDRIIAFVNNTIYRGNPKEEDINTVIFELKNGKAQISNLIGIPLAYIKEIILEKNKDDIEILFGKNSTETIRIKDENSKNEIFDFLKINIKNSKHIIEEPSKLKTGKRPLIAMSVLFALFLLSLYFALEIEKGNYDVIPEKANIILSLVLQISFLGSKYVILIFSILFMVPFINFINKTKRKKIIDKIVIIR